MGNQTRLIGGTRNTSSDRRPLDTFTKTVRSDERAVIGGIWDTELAGRAWTIDVSYTASEHDSATTQVQDTLSAQMELAIAGLGGPNCDIVNGTPGDGNQRYADSGGVFSIQQGAIATTLTLLVTLDLTATEMNRLT